MRAVLTYHSLDDSGSPISIAPADFRRHVAWLASGAVRVLPLRELVAEPTGNTNTDRHAERHADRHAVAITFDDGFANFAEFAAPLLLEHNLPATVFVVSQHVGGDNCWGGVRRDGIPALPLMDWDALGAIAADGVELGAHTRTHPHLSQLSAAAIADEIAGAAEDILARTGQRPRAFAYPYGDCNATSAAVSRAQFDCACTTEYRSLTPHEDPARVPRLDAWYFRHGERLAHWGSLSFRLRLRARAGARAARRLLRHD